MSTIVLTGACDQHGHRFLHTEDTAHAGKMTFCLKCIHDDPALALTAEGNKHFRLMQDEVGRSEDDAVIAMCKAAMTVRDGRWFSGAPTHIFAAFLTALEDAGWKLTRDG